MRVFVTGASGFIGQPVVQGLLKDGHHVTGLARSDKSAEALKALGAEVLRGDLEDLETLKNGASAADGVLHLGFVHDFSDFPGSCAKDQAALKAMGEAMEGTDKFLVNTSGTLVLPHGRLVTEDDGPGTEAFALLRGPSEELTLSFAAKGVRAMVIRLAPVNHGKGDHGFIPIYMGIAKEKGSCAYIGDGANRWPSTHHHDAARVYRLAMEKGEAGAVYHAIAEGGTPVKEIAEALAKKMNLPVVSITAEQAGEHFGWFAGPVGSDNPASSEKTRQKLGWQPVEKTLMANLDGTYF